MADSDAPRGTLHFPRRRLQALAAGYRGGRACLPQTGRRSAVPQSGTVCAGDQQLMLRPAGPEDAALARELHRRCSLATLSRRYLGPVDEADRYLPHLLDPHHGRALAAETDIGDLVALGHLLWDGDETEVALLVEDGWQRRGIGSALLWQLIGLAVQARCTTMYAITQASNAGMIAAMQGTGLPLDRDLQDDALVLTARLTPLLTPTAPLPAPAIR